MLFRRLSLYLFLLSGVSFWGVSQAMPTDQAEFRNANALLADHVAKNSPTLARREWAAISQDYNGAPLDGAPRIHRFGAQSVSCRTTITPSATATCKIAYAGGNARQLDPSDSQALFDALETLGVEEDKSTEHIVRTMNDVRCRVSDKAAQNAPGGQGLYGFMCRFK